MATHKVSVLLLGELGRRFGRRHKLAVSSAAEAIRALCANFPQFERELVSSGERGIGYRVLAGREALSLERLHEPTGQQHIVIAPMISGAGGGLGQIFMGIAIIAISWWNPMGWAAAGAFLSQSTLYSIGTAMILGGVAQMISPIPKASDPSERPENKPSYSFNGAVNTTAQGHPVPVGYGRLIVGSAVISAGIDVDEVPA